MTDFHTTFIIDLVSGMQSSCYEYDVEEMFGRRGVSLIMGAMNESEAEND